MSEDYRALTANNLTNSIYELIRLSIDMETETFYYGSAYELDTAIEKEKLFISRCMGSLTSHNINL